MEGSRRRRRLVGLGLVVLLLFVLVLLGLGLLGIGLGGLGWRAPGPGPGGAAPPTAGTALAPQPPFPDSVPAIRFRATLQAAAFASGEAPDARYHAVVGRGGTAAARALLVTDLDDGELAAALRALGAEDGGGVPLRAWTWRRLPLVPQPDSKVRGSEVRAFVSWEGAGREYELGELLEDAGGRGVELRFGGNEEHDHRWHSGCLVCLFSCPGGVVSNAAYSIRDHTREVTRFSPRSDILPPDGTALDVTLVLLTRSSSVARPPGAV